MRLLQQLKDKTEILLCIYAGDIERKKIRADFGITYDADALKLIDDLRPGEWTCARWSLPGMRTSPLPPYSRTSWNAAASRCTPTAHQGLSHGRGPIVSDNGYGANAYIETNQPLVVVTGPGPAAANWPPAFPSFIMTTIGA